MSTIEQLALQQSSVQRLGVSPLSGYVPVSRLQLLSIGLYGMSGSPLTRPEASNGLYFARDSTFGTSHIISPSPETAIFKATSSPFHFILLPS
jgi:hypothetical protein